MILTGKVHRYGENVDTDVIIPARYLNSSNPAELASHCMEDIDSDFVKKVKPGDIIVADENFGCGSSREHAPIAIKESGISAVIAKTFARIFYRNAINIGLPILQCPEAVDAIAAGDEVRIDTSTGQITNVTSGKVFQAMPFPEFMQKLIAAGGLIEYAKEKVASGNGPKCCCQSDSCG
jgi:3-isopropylmalate/(R)-2-methylmalate dehydratase small subunit